MFEMTSITWKYSKKVLFRKWWFGKWKRQ